MILDLLKGFIPSIAAFWIGIAIAPILTHYLYKYRVWKKHGGKTALDGSAAVVFTELRAETETKTPRMGGILIWASVALTTIGIWIFAQFFPSDITTKLDFLTRNQTWIPLMTLLAGAVVGLLNDILDVTDPRGEKGIPLLTRLVFVLLISMFIGWWF